MNGEIVGNGSGLIGVVGLVCGIDREVFLLDSGASSNFIS